MIVVGTLSFSVVFPWFEIWPFFFFLREKIPEETKGLLVQKDMVSLPTSIFQIGHLCLQGLLNISLICLKIGKKLNRLIEEGWRYNFSSNFTEREDSF